jgi:hypothetical protein
MTFPCDPGIILSPTYSGDREPLAPLHQPTPFTAILPWTPGNVIL